MSRVILSRHADGSHHVVVGWDHPARGAFWQEYATAEGVARARAWMEDNCDNEELFATEEYCRMEILAETGISREGGMWPGIPLSQLVVSMPEALRPLVTPKVMKLLGDHRDDDRSGRLAPMDLTKGTP